ncbi:MAG: division/cell wall cluster transcriptional repressor MraZ [Chitinophagales bacterium]|nr:division/cell wall cluster transcriptional repressor MraZ [Chitinophagales bacterium]
MAQTRFLGEFPCTLDDKGRFLFPGGLKKQVPAKAKNRFIIHRGFEKCLAMYAFHDWQDISAEVNRLNLYVKNNRDFARYFFRGATEVELDGTSRMLLPRSLCEYADIKKDILLLGYANRIEVWSEQLYHRQMDEEPRDFVKLAEEVMGRLITVAK